MKKRLLSLILTAILLLQLCPAVFADAPGEVLRVGFFAFSGYHIVDGNGRRSGYGYEFLQRLASHADWTYTYEGYDRSYADALEMLRNGEVDLVTSVSKTPEREEDFLFSDQNIGVNSTVLTVKAENGKITAGDYATYDGMKVGMLEGNSKNANFERFAAEQGFSFEPVYFAGQEELSAALQAETIDAAVTGSLRQLENEWLLDSFDASPFYVCVRKDRADLMERINAAINAMDLSEPNWRDTLHEKYYATDAGGYFVISAKERAFLNTLLEEGRTLRLLFNPEQAPYAYFEDGEAKGVLPAIFRTLADRLSLRYEFLPVENRASYLEIRAAGEADIVLDFTGDYYLAEEEGYKITEPYYKTNYARLTLSRAGTRKPGSTETLAVADLPGLLDNYSPSRYPYISLLQCGSAEECVDAVLSGKADAAILYSLTAEQYVHEDVRSRLASNVMGETSLSFAVGAGIPEGHLLLSLLDKGMDSFSEAELDTIVTQEINAGRSTEISLLAFFYRNPGYALLTALAAFVLLFTLTLLVVRTRNQRSLKEKISLATGELEKKTEELSHALEAADAANKAKTTFLNNMSHDIRTPMNAIIGYTALTSTHLDNKERARDYLSKIAQASNHLLSLINDVLDMSRIESGKITIESRPETLSDILQGIRNIIQSDVHAKGLELFIDTVDITDEEIFCDRLRLNQILLNLTSNAIKFTPSGGSVSIRVTQKPSQKPGRGIYEFLVSDTGIGMSPEFAKTVFEPFTRERSSTVSGIQGTGLGMAITKNIVDMMGGEIWVESEPGKGTAFTVRLELRFTENHSDVGPIPELSGYKGLVVDDDLVSCQSVSKMLRKIGMRAEWTLSGKEAVVRTSEAIELADPFEVYIVDWSMPNMSGVETVRQIRAIVGDISPIILMSAYDWSDIEVEARKAGVTGFISKPLFASDLHRTLEISLGHRTEPGDVREAAKTDDGFHGKRILLAEDNELNREIAKELLEEAGFVIECAENGRQACDMVRAAAPGHFDLILMDIQMPILDGYGATKEIRSMEDPARSKLPIIAMTANAFEEDRDLAMKAGMDGHLPKPIDVDKMLDLLREILKKAK